MNSYPPELLTQLAPVMFVAGLGAPPPPNPPQSPATKPQDPFALLALRLKDALLAQRKPGIWQSDKSKTFQAVLVDPDIRFPPRKLPPPEDQQFLPTHSPLSPLTPTSPLYPDGLIAPIWIRKHTALVPSVFVLFKRIYEHSRQLPTSPLELADPEREKEREAEEKRRDAELAAEIALRKKTTNERSIKLTVVLMASRRMLDDPTLDTRLTYIRRQSGLDPRAALFVLSPVTQSEIGDFVRSLQEALYEPALEYYTNHSKRVRRKRNRHTQTNAYAMPLSPVANIPRPLRSEGWTVRYEYKMACFAEFRGEDEVALKHYQDAYGALQTMFGSTAILPPRTKRWAEAKVLADTISVKICKLYLYNSEHSLALSHHTSHMRKFSDLSRGWGIGEETFEYWSWLARQHRVFAELLEQGTRSALQIPTYLPASISAASTVTLQGAETGRTAMELEAIRTLGINPSQALQSPGFYYYMAARCTEHRRNRFLQVLENESPHNPAMQSPGFINEKKVDHPTVILELYTRSYELFKKSSPTGAQSQGRQTLWIAYRIAQTYYESGKFDMAVRFFERIAKTYRREKWDAMLIPLLSTWYACAQQLGDMDLGVQLLIEMLAHGSVTDLEEPDAIQEDLLAVMRSTVPTLQDKAFVVDLSEAEPLVDSSLVFWRPEVNVGERAVYQLTLSVPSHVYISSLPFESLVIHFHDDAPRIVVRHSAPEGEIPLIQTVDLGHLDYSALDEDALEVSAPLRWSPGGSIVFSGSLSSNIPCTMSPSKLLLTLKEGSWWIELPMSCTTTRSGTTPPARWLSSLNPPRFLPIQRDSQLSISSALVRRRPHSINVELKHTAPAYVGEVYPISIDVVNTDDRELEITADVMLQPSEIEEAVSSISDDNEAWSNLIKGISLGVLPPGAHAVQTLYLSSAGATGDRTIDISVQSRDKATESSASPLSPKSPLITKEDIRETLNTLVVPTADPLKAHHNVKYRRSMKPQPGLTDLSTFDEDYWDDSEGGEAVIVTTWTCSGPYGVKIEDVKITEQTGPFAKIIEPEDALEREQILDIWLPGDEFNNQCRISLAPNEDQLDGSIAGPGLYEISWRKLLPGNELGLLTKTSYPFPALKPPVDGLIALLDVPARAKLHTPVPLKLTIRNTHPIRSANVVIQVEFDPTDGFVVAGLRGGRLPILLPGGEEVVTWNLIPVECGFVKIPHIKVTDRRVALSANSQASPAEGQAAGEGERVRVVDVRWDWRSEEVGEVKNAQMASDPVLLVLP